MENKVLVGILAVFLALVLAGEAMLYFVDVDHYESDAEWNGSGFDYSLSTSGNDVYDVYCLDGTERISTLLVYKDKLYSELSDQ